LHEAFLCSADKRPAVPAYSLRLTGVAFAFLQEACFRGTRKGLAFPAHGSALAGILRGRRSEIQRQHQCSQKNSFHVSPPFIAIGSTFRVPVGVVGLSLDLVETIIFCPFRPLPQAYFAGVQEMNGEQELDERRLHF